MSCLTLTMDRAAARPCLDDAVPVQLLPQLGTRVARMARHYARRSGEDPEDLEQEAWLGLCEGLRDHDPRRGGMRGYLLRRAKWRMLDAIKYARVRKREALAAGTESALSPLELARPPTYCGESRAMALEFSAGLSPVQRAVLACLLDGLTWREAGARLGCSSANIGYHVQEIRRQYECWAQSAASV